MKNQVCTCGFLLLYNNVISDLSKKFSNLIVEEEGNKNTVEAPVNILDELFRKTDTSPHLYWLPLSEAEVIIFRPLRSIFICFDFVLFG